VSRGLQVSMPFESSFLEVPFLYNLFGVLHIRVRWAAVIGTYALTVAQVIFTPPSVEGGLVSPATTSADSATLARVDEFLMNCRRNFLELRLGEVRRIHLPRLYEKWFSDGISLL
jgi:hypothetical protein